MKMPHPGQLRHLLEIGQTVNGKNENGYPAPEDSIICTVWAAVEDDSSRFYFTGDADNAERGGAAGDDTGDVVIAHIKEFQGEIRGLGQEFPARVVNVDPDLAQQGGTVFVQPALGLDG